MLDLDGLAAWGVPPPEVDGAQVRGALHLLHLDEVDDARPDLLAALAQRSGVVVGIARGELSRGARALAEAVDLTLTEQDDDDPALVTVSDLDAAVDQLVAGAARYPRATLVTAALLRTAGRLPLAEALAAEASAYSTLLAGPEHAAWLAARGPVRRPPDGGERVAVRRDGNVLTVRLDRPARRNAFDAAMRRALVEALSVGLADHDVRVEVSGEGPVFSAGGDLDEFGSTADPATAWVVRTAEHPGRSLALLGPRVHVHVHGHCHGAGVELPALAARVTAAPGTTFRLPELSLGLLPGAGGTVGVPARIGRWRAAWMALTGDAVDATTALRWGLVDGVDEGRGD